MPAVSQAQQRYMSMCAHDPSHANGSCPSPKVAKEFATTGGQSLASLPAYAPKSKAKSSGYTKAPGDMR
jgi:hypothetical protein